METAQTSVFKRIPVHRTRTHPLGCTRARPQIRWPRTRALGGGWWMSSASATSAHSHAPPRCLGGPSATPRPRREPRLVAAHSETARAASQARRRRADGSSASVSAPAWRQDVVEGRLVEKGRRLGVLEVLVARDHVEARPDDRRRPARPRQTRTHTGAVSTQPAESRGGAPAANPRPEEGAAGAAEHTVALRPLRRLVAGRGPPRAAPARGQPHQVSR